MEELDLLLKEACLKVAEMEIDQLESDTTEYTPSEMFKQKMKESFPFLVESE